MDSMVNPPSPVVVEDCFGLLKLYSDGSIFRANDINRYQIQDDGSAVWKDCIFNQEYNLHLRLYKPVAANEIAKLPIVYFLHGGGFCFGSCAWPNFHNCCLRLSSGLQALVVAPDYRLAPEHRLPAAVDDGLSAVKWLQTQALSKTPDTWLSGDGVDFGRVFIFGDSSGGNMAHHLAVRLGAGSPELAPVRIRGYVLMAPFFGGGERTKSEAEGEPEIEGLLNIGVLESFWRLSVPIGETADYPLANPFGPKSPSLEAVKLDPILLIAGGRELLKDRVENYGNKLKEMGKKVEYVEFEGKQHGFFTNDPFSDVSHTVLQLITNFMLQHSS